MLCNFIDFSSVIIAATPKGSKKTTVRHRHARTVKGEINISLPVTPLLDVISSAMKFVADVKLKGTD